MILVYFKPFGFSVNWTQNSPKVCKNFYLGQLNLSQYYDDPKPIITIKITIRIWGIIIPLWDNIARFHQNIVRNWVMKCSVPLGAST